MSSKQKNCFKFQVCFKYVEHRSPYIIWMPIQYFNMNIFFYFFIDFFLNNVLYLNIILDYRFPVLFLKITQKFTLLQNISSNIFSIDNCFHIVSLLIVVFCVRCGILQPCFFKTKWFISTGLYNVFSSYLLLRVTIRSGCWLFELY